MMMFALEATSLGDAADFRPGLFQFFERLGDNVVNDELMSRLDKILAHGLAHDSQTHKTDFCHLAHSSDFLFEPVT